MDRQFMIKKRIAIFLEDKNFISIVLILLGISLCTLLLILQIHNTINSCPMYDDAYNATVAKSLAFGKGYATFRYGNKKMFNPEITTGPTLILPCAGLIKIFGNKYWVPNMTAAAVNTLLLIVLVYLFRKIIASQLSYKYFAVVYLWLILSVCYNNTYYSLLGETTAFLLLAIAIAAACSEGEKKTIDYLAGLLMGFALLTKVLAAIGIVAYFAVASIYWMKRREKKLARKIVIIVLGVATVLLAFRIYQAVSIGNITDWKEVIHEERKLFINVGSGIKIMKSNMPFSQLLIKMKQNIIDKKEELSRNTNLRVFGASLLIWIGLFIYSIISFARDREYQYGPKAISMIFQITFLLNAIWWIAIMEGGYYRHLQIGISFGTLGSAIVIAELLGEIRMKYVQLIAVGAIVSIVSVYEVNRYEDINYNPSARVKSLVSTANYISDHMSPEKHYMGLNWWANPDIEYLLPETAQIENLAAVIPRESEKYYLVRSEIWSANGSYYSLMKNTWIPNCTIEQKRIYEINDENIVFQDQPFRIIEVKKWL